MDFDEDRLYYSHQQLQTTRNDDGDGPDAAVDDANDDDGQADLEAVRRHFREFLRNYRLGQQRYLYREKLLRMHRRLANSSNASGDDPAVAADAAKNANTAKLEVDLAHVGEYDAALLGFILSQPATLLPALEKATVEALRSLLYSSSTNNNRNDLDPDGIVPETEPVLDSLAIQVLFKGNLKPTPLRAIHSEHINKLLKCPGIVISTSPVKNRAVKLVVRCQRCLHTRTIVATDGPFGSVTLPMVCAGPVDPEECGRYPYAVAPDQSQFVDQQTLKLQEAPERVPTGEMPRSILMAVERSLVDVAPPGTRVSVLCIPTLFTTASRNGHSSDATKQVYLRVVGMVKDNDAHGQAATFTPQEEEAFQAVSRHPNVYDILQRSIAPDISGSYTVDIKKALACQLFGGSSKKLPDGVRLRGDINCLLLGDPSMAKSQFLKAASKISPIGIYTSGKGSSAAGLTASVVRDAKGEFYLEGGAMVLGDGGLVCIDEFDKMRPNDRVAIHEAMEQNTISIAKAGITTVLNARASVLAAANPVYGRYDDGRSASENIDLMTTILSRFDLIFLVRDIREEERDRMICQHVMGVHINNSRNSDGLGHVRPTAGADASALSYMAASAMPGGPNATESGVAVNSPEAIAENIMQAIASSEGELSIPAMKQYVQYCKAKCSPRLTDEAGEILTSSYVKIRDDVRKQAITSRTSNGNDDNQAAIPITVRQLEALVRLSESLAKMRLENEVQPQDVTEALRLFRVSTMTANAADQTSANSNGGLSAVAAPNRQEMERTESFLRSRLAIGGMMVNKQRIIEEAVGQGFNAVLVARALSVMVSRGELMERNQGRLLKRVK